MLTDDFAEYLRAERNRSPLTVRNYELALREFGSFLDTLRPGWQWADVASEEVREWMVWMMDQEGKKAASVNLNLSALRTFYRYLMQTGQASSNPCAKVLGPRKEKRLPSFVREEQMDTLLDDVQFADDFAGVRNRLIILMLYMTGMRRAEILGLRNCDVQLREQKIVVTGKGNKQRIIPCSATLVREVRRYITARKDAFGRQPAEAPFLLNNRGRAMSAPSLNTIVKAALSIVTQQKRRGPHVLRHTFATMMLNHGAGLQSIQKLLGHASLKTTEIYTHLSFEDLKKEYGSAHPRANEPQE